MNGTSESLAEIDTLIKEHAEAGCDMLICPPATLIQRLAEAAKDANLAVTCEQHVFVLGCFDADIFDGRDRSADKPLVIFRLIS